MISPSSASADGPPECAEVRIGFIPLSDCAPIVAAHELGIFQRHGVNVTLSREPSWSSIRDKVAVGVLDAAHMLAPMPLAATLGIDGIARPMVTALSLGLNGNAITVSSGLHAEMLAVAPELATDRSRAALALKSVVDARDDAGLEPLTFATVFPFSSHNYQLRYWLASTGIDPDRDVRIVVVPPPQMVDLLGTGEIDGYCVGEPWNSMAVAEGLGHVAITGHELWNNSPEKVLGVTADWAEKNPRSHIALIQALLEACAWVDAPENRPKVAKMIASPDYVGAPLETIECAMLGSFIYDHGQPPHALPDFHVFHRYAATFPWRSHAVWFLSQMIRWGQADRSIDLHTTAEHVYRVDIYREAAARMGLPAPLIDYKREGIHASPYELDSGSTPVRLGSDLIHDGRTFDPRNPLDYLDTIAAGFNTA